MVFLPMQAGDAKYLAASKKSCTIAKLQRDR
jgi:hypothetical protein